MGLTIEIIQSGKWKEKIVDNLPVGKYQPF